MRNTEMRMRKKIRFIDLPCCCNHPNKIQKDIYQSESCHKEDESDSCIDRRGLRMFMFLIISIGRCILYPCPDDGSYGKYSTKSYSSFSNNLYTISHSCTTSWSRLDSGRTSCTIFQELSRIRSRSIAFTWTRKKTQSRKQTE